MRLLIAVACVCLVSGYEPTWESLDTRPLPQWYDDAKLGIFIHWGVYSVPSFGNEWFWRDWHYHKEPYVSFVKDNYPPGWTYADFAKDFTAEFYDPKEWAKIFEASGAKYVVLTSKHHEGYTLWPSSHSFSWNSMSVGSKRDLVGELATAVKSSTSMKFGVYYSLFEWFNPLYIQDRNHLYRTRDFAKQKSMPELYELVNTYEPEIVWADGEAGALNRYWESREFVAWLYNDSPVKDTVVVNDRWGLGNRCRHGDIFTCEDRYQPTELVDHKWESCNPLDKASFGFRRDARLSDYMTPEEVINVLVTTVSYGGNLLLNIGPTHDGRLPTIMEERLMQLGQWMDINGEVIYGTKPWQHQHDTDAKTTWYTWNGKDDVYAITLEWPEKDTLVLESVRMNNNTEVRMCGQEGPLSFKENEQGHMEITLPNYASVKSQWGWAFILSNVQAK